MTDQRLLRGHKRVGKRFIPPMKQLPGMKETSYVNDMLPELVWIGLINDRLGYVPGARLFEKIVLAAMEAAGEAPNRNYALLSEVAELNTVQRVSFMNTLSAEAMPEPLREYIAPLTLLYDGCPLAFIGPPEKVYREEQLIKSIRACVERHIDKYETPAIVLHGAILLARLVAGTISFSADIKIPDRAYAFESGLGTNVTSITFMGALDR